MDIEMRDVDSESKRRQNRAHATDLGGSYDRDAATLARMGKIQVLKRNFGFLSMLSFSCTILATWEGVLILFATGFTNGGPAGLVYQFLLVWGGTFCTFVSIGELASMAPTAGGQYHWVCMLAPRAIRNFVSYMTGWMTILAWLATIATGSFLSASMIQALCLINWPDYANHVQPYQSTLVTFLIIIICVFFNTVVGGLLPKVEGAFLILHILGFFAILIPLLYYSPKGSASELFSTYLNEGGWSSYGLSFMVGSIGAAFSFVGADAAVHMSEEIANAAINVPRSIVTSVIINGSLGFGMLLAVIFCMGDPEKALAAANTIGFPFVEIFVQATGSLAGSTGMTAIIIALAFSSTVGFLATTSRMIWSFARDKGLPFSNFLSQISNKTTIPTAAVIVASVIPALLILINLGSSVVFNDVTSLALVGFYSTYLLAVSFLLYRRITNTIRKPTSGSAYSPARLNEGTGEYELFWGPWHVPGWLGIANNLVSVCYLTTIWLFAFFPPTAKVTPSTMNFSSLVFGATVLYSLVYYVVWGRKQYKGPVVEIVM